MSTDVAVRPSNIMGANKRIAEVVLKSLSKNQDITRFTMVRSGNAASITRLTQLPDSHRGRIGVT